MLIITKISIFNFPIYILGMVLNPQNVEPKTNPLILNT